VSDFPHASVNVVHRDGDHVVKRFVGPRAEERCSSERRAVASLRGHLPVPEILLYDDVSMATRFVPGVNGRVALSEGDAAEVLELSGTTLRMLQTVPARTVFGDAPDSLVVVHGDFGPNNLVIDPGTGHVAAVVDWEWCHLGESVEDVAWCEWTVRNHHPEYAHLLGAFFDSYGTTPPWAERHGAMLSQLRRLLAFAVDRDGDSPLVVARRAQLSATEQWSQMHP
jgi:aminoglycoside phosphotransferase